MTVERPRFPTLKVAYLWNCNESHFKRWRQPPGKDNVWKMNDFRQIRLHFTYRKLILRKQWLVYIRLFMHWQSAIHVCRQPLNLCSAFHRQVRKATTQKNQTHGKAHVKTRPAVMQNSSVDKTNKNWLSWQRLLRDRTPLISDWSSAAHFSINLENLVKIGAADFLINCRTGIVKERKIY